MRRERTGLTRCSTATRMCAPPDCGAATHVACAGRVRIAGLVVVDPTPAGLGLFAASGRTGVCLWLQCRRLRAGRKPLAALGLDLAVALRVRSARVVGAGLPPCQSPTRPRAKEDLMNRWT